MSQSAPASVHFSSATSDWATPQPLFDALHREFGFTLDVCASKDNAKCPEFFTEEQDALHREWRGICWMNPPYGNPEHPCKPGCTKKLCQKRGFHSAKYVPGINDFMRKAYCSAMAGATVVCLVPARPDTDWWHDWAARATEIRFFRGRLKFGAAVNSAPFPSALVIFRTGQLCTGRVIHTRPPGLMSTGRLPL